MAVGAIVMGVGALASAGGSLASGLIGAKSAARQARAQKAATTRYAKALQQQASKMQGGMSQARIRSLQAAGAIQRASEAQQSRTEAARGGRAPSAMLEAELGAAQQMAAVEQQKMLDQLSQQTAERKAATRQQLQGAALQAQAQAQAIDPKAAYQAALAPGLGQAIGTLGSAAFQTASSIAVPTMKQQYQAKQFEKDENQLLTARNLAKAGEGLEVDERGFYKFTKDMNPQQVSALRQINARYAQSMPGNYRGLQSQYLPSVPPMSMGPTGGSQ